MTASVAYVLYRDLSKELRGLEASGMGDSPEADALRDKMDAPWYAMTTEERSRVGDDDDM